MNLNDFRRLEDKVVKPDYNKDYKGLNYVLRGLSIFGNFASIFLASLFVSELLKVATDNTYVIWTVTLVLLGGLELLKRELFFRFTRDFIRTNEVFNSSVLPMLISVCILVSLSFYSSLSGANEISSKSDILVAQTDSVVNNTADSISAIYVLKITEIENNNKDLVAENNKKRGDISTKTEQQNTITSLARRRNISNEITQLKEDIRYNDEVIAQNKKEIDDIKAEKEREIAKVSDKLSADVDKKIDTNRSDSYIFIAISTLIEFIILIGIYFGNLYNFRSYRDIKNKILHNAEFKKFYDYMNLIDSIYLNRGESDKVPPISIIKNLLVSHKIYLTESDITSSLELLEQLNVVKTNEEHMWIAVDRKEAENILNKHFHIK